MCGTAPVSTVIVGIVCRTLVLVSVGSRPFLVLRKAGLPSMRMIWLSGVRFATSILLSCKLLMSREGIILRISSRVARASLSLRKWRCVRLMW